MVRSIRLLAAAALAAGFAAATPAAHAQTGPQDEGAVQTTGPLEATPQKAKPRQAALKKRAAKTPGPAGRQITVHARPSYLTPRHAAPSARSATATSTARSTSRRRSRAPSWACAAGRGSPTRSATPRRNDLVQVLNSARDHKDRSGRRNNASTATSNPGGSTSAAPSVSRESRSRRRRRVCDE